MTLNRKPLSVAVGVLAVSSLLAPPAFATIGTTTVPKPLVKACVDPFVRAGDAPTIYKNKVNSDGSVTKVAVAVVNPNRCVYHPSAAFLARRPFTCKVGPSDKDATKNASGQITEVDPNQTVVTKTVKVKGVTRTIKTCKIITPAKPKAACRPGFALTTVTYVKADGTPLFVTGSTTVPKTAKICYPGTGKPVTVRTSGTGS